MADADDTVTVATADPDDLHGRLYRPLGPGPHPGVLVVHGSDPNAEFPDEYARLLATHGYAAFRIRYFDAPGVPDDLAEVPIEYFERAIDSLLDRGVVSGDRVGVVAWSRGSEAAFLLGDGDPRVGAVAGYVPGVYVFPGRPAALEPVSPWSVDGEPLPHVPLYDGVEDDEDAPAVVKFRRAVERAPDEALERAALPVGGVDGPVVLTSGGDDRVWPSSEFAATLVGRLDREGHVHPHEHRDFPDAGHAIAIPYQPLDDAVLEYMGGSRDGTLHAPNVGWERTLACLRRGLADRDSR